MAIAGARPQGRSAFPAVCLAAAAIVWLGLALAPRSRADWLLENLPVFVLVPIAVASHRRFRFSNRAYAQATIFFVLHAIGSHYTYSEVPLGHWLREACALSRNHYDRLVHFSFGLLMLRPVRELGFGRDAAHPRPAAVLYFSIAGVAWWSLLYEVVEWLVARIADPAAGVAYLGTQGDVWDAQKDMALALLGAVVAGTFEWWHDSCDRRRR